MSDATTLPYRPCAGVMLVNPAGLVFVGQRIDAAMEAWQMPQGGIDPGEDAETAARRELGEETGISPAHVELIAPGDRELFYDLPPELVGKAWRGKWRGQRQWWFLFRFTGRDSDVHIDTPHPEFRAWRWADPEELPGVAVPFKRALYEDVLTMFRPHLPHA
jgi:putative (di)nucleoside polyphosphate hydrolase